MEMRLQKILSQAGIASRRAAERLIAEGRVTVDGVTMREMGVKADPASADIRVDGVRVKAAARHRYILLNKPAGYVTTRSDPQRRKTVLDLLHGVREYVYPVGRLDYDSEGLLLLTNDGELAARLTHPRHGVERTYEAHVAGVPDEAAIERLRRGIPLDGRYTLPARVVPLSRPARTAEDRQRGSGARGREREGVLLITIREGRNRQVRRMCEAVGHPVARLKRTTFGPIADRRLRPGEWRDLTSEEVAALRRAAAGTAPGRSERDRGATTPRQGSSERSAGASSGRESARSSARPSTSSGRTSARSSAGGAASTRPSRRSSRRS